MFNNFSPSWLRIPHREDTLFSVMFLLCLIVPVMFATFFVEGFETVKYPIFLLLTGAAALVLIKRKNFYVNLPISVLLVLFWLLNLLSTIFSLDAINSVIGLYGRYPGSLIFITGWVLSIVLMWSALCNEETRRLTLIRIVMFQGLAIAILGIAQQFNFGYYGGMTTQIRPIIPSFIGNQNFYAMYLLGAVAAVGVLLQHSKTRAASYYYALCGVIVVFAIILSGSRGGMLGLAATCAVYLGIVLWRKYPKIHLVTILGLIALSGLLYAGFHATLRADQLPGAGSAAEYTTQSRYVIWADSLKLVAENPVLGTGHGNFLTAFQRLGDTALSGNERFDDAHNLFLHLGVTIGLPGLLLFILLIGFVLFKAWRKTKEKETSALWAASALVGVLVAGCFNPVSISTWVIMFLAIAFCSSYESKKIQLAPWAKILLGIAAVALIIISICFTASEILSVFGKRSYRAQDNHDTQKTLTLARKFNPANSTASVYLIASQINLKAESKEINQSIENLVSQHPQAAGLYKSAADLFFRLYDSTKDEQYRQKMNEMLETAEQLEPNSATLYGSASYLQYKAGQSDEALASLARLLSLPDNDQYPYSWLLRAEIYLEKGNKEKALFSLEKAYRQMTGELLIKKFIEEVRRADDVSKLRIPVYFPEVDL